MDPKVCMNTSCGVTSTNHWRNGWPLRAGGVANLCDACGISYNKSVFCDMFHAGETGWRDCGSCGKRLHCGCIASKFLFELLDSGGVECMKGTKSSIHCLVPRAGQLALSSPPYTPGLLPSKCSTNEKGNAISQQNYADEIISTSFTARIDRCNVDRSAIWKLNTDLHGSLRNVNNAEDNDIMGPFSKIKEEGDDCDPTSNGYLHISLGTSSSGNGIDSSNLLTKEKLASFAESREQNKTSVRHGQRAPHVLLKPSSTRSTTGSELTKDIPPQVRVPRPPGEGRGKNQLLPRYWPRITDKELQQISGDSNSKIVPLFEKVLSASDAGRIGRLVLPKACAEAYFPPISQPEGLPLTIQDAKGKDWLFQFRFWPNNNSRMYVLEGVTPCIQSMQLQAGDTVTFSRIDPEEKLVMGFRKAANTAYIHESQIAVPGNGGSGNDAYLSGVIENLPSIRGYSRPFHSLKGNADRHLNNLSEHLDMSDTDIGCGKADKHGSRTKEELQPQSRIREKKRSRNISSKSKRLHIDSEYAIELKITWEEAQDLLRPPPSVKPSIVMIEDYEFEEYEEPPVFGKRSIFTSRSSGGNDQWAQCDNCLKWRRFPIDVLLPPKWMCAENSWDHQRCSCSVPEEISSNALQDLLRIRDLKKRKGFDSPKTMLRDVSALDALATAAVLGETGDEAPSTATTKHPRHRPGCSCIVCIQPPSGKGPKHKPTCACNVCMTVRRRFKTLMMRRKKRQSEREADAAQKKSAWTKEEGDIDDVSKCSMQLDTSENEGRLMCTPESISQIRIVGEKVETDNSLKLCTKDEIKGQIDLNCDPDREDDAIAVGPSESHVSMMTLLQVASLPLDTYLQQNGLTSFVGDQQTGPIVSVLPSIEVESSLEESHFPLVPEEEAIIPGDAPLPVDRMASGST